MNSVMAALPKAASTQGSGIAITTIRKLVDGICRNANLVQMHMYHVKDLMTESAAGDPYLWKTLASEIMLAILKKMAFPWKFNTKLLSNGDLKMI